MKNYSKSKGFTLLEVLVGLAIFLGVVIPLIRYLVIFTVTNTVKDKKNAYSILRSECAIMYKNHKLPNPTKIVTIDNRAYEISFNAEKESVLVDWSMYIKKDGKSIASMHGLLFVPIMQDGKSP